MTVNQSKAVALIMLMLCMAIISIVAPINNLEPSVHPRLLQLAVQSPQSRVDIIIQQRTDDPELQTIITQHGGIIIRLLPIVNGFSAEVPANIIPSLGKIPTVRWITPDELTHHDQPEQ